MQGSISVQVLASLSDNGFSLDELVLATKELFEREGLAGFVSFLLGLLDEKLAMEVVAERSIWTPPACCQGPRYEHHDRQPRQLRTSVGKVKIQWRRVRCVCCGKSTVLLRRFLGLDNYQSKTSELEKLVTEVVSEQNYRRSSDHLRRIGEIPVPRSTLHRWVVTGGCDTIEPAEDTLKALVADATAYKQRHAPGQSNRGEIEVALGIGASQTFGRLERPVVAADCRAAQAGQADARACGGRAGQRRRDRDGPCPGGLGQPRAAMPLAHGS